MSVNCDYCNSVAELVSGDVIYPHRKDLYKKFFYRCESCDAYVGCHPNTLTPLGRLADAELRKAKSLAHKAFDPIWKIGEVSRSKAYSWLAKQLGIEKRKCHIGMFDIDMCKRVVDVCVARDF